MGTGDGLFVYQSARRNPTKFYIGVDASTRPLEKISEKIYRKSTKDGLPNALFIQASVEDLSDELNEIANEVYVHFPWGSLLRGVATGTELLLDNLRRICSSNARLEIIIGIDSARDASELKRLQMPTLTEDYIDSVLVPRYRRAGLTIVQRETLPQITWSTINTSWAKRLKGNPHRSLTRIVALACPINGPCPVQD